MNEIIKGIEKIIYQHGYHILLGSSDDDQEKEKSHLEMLLHKGVDGFIVFFVTPKRGERFDYSHLKNLKKRNIPLVFIDRYLPAEPIDWVVCDDFWGAYEAVSHLISLGHKKIAHLTVRDNCTSVKNRLEGYKKALLDAGIEINREYIKMREFKKKGDALRIAKKFLRLKSRPTAIFTVTDGEAREVFQAIKEEGLKVPEDIALVGFGNSPESSLLEVPLTCVDQPKEKLGEKAAEILIEKLEYPEEANLRQIFLKPRLIIRKSSGAGKMDLAVQKT